MKSIFENYIYLFQKKKNDSQNDKISGGIFILLVEWVVDII
jgi:hypothetical protein